MTWTVEWGKAADRDLGSLPAKARERIYAALDRLAESFHGDICKLSGGSDLWRLRVGTWRVLFEVDTKERLIVIQRIAHRREAYR